MDNLQLRFAKEIKVNNFTIKIPQVKNIVKLGEKKYNQFLRPYFITKDIIRCDDNLLNQIRNFDLFFMPGKDNKPILMYDDETSFLDLLLESLGFYFNESVSLLNAKDLKYNNIVDLGYNDDILSQIHYIVVENGGLIDRENFDDIANVILKINFTKKSEIKPEPEFKNDRQRDIYNKIMEGRKRKSEKETDTFNDITRVVQFGGKSFISYNEIEEFTIYQLMDAYVSILSIDSFNINFGQYQAGVEPNKLDLEHWVNKMKQINNQ